MKASLVLVIRLSLNYPHVPDKARMSNHQASYVVSNRLIFVFCCTNQKDVLEKEMKDWVLKSIFCSKRIAIATRIFDYSWFLVLEIWIYHSNTLANWWKLYHLLIRIVCVLLLLQENLMTKSLKSGYFQKKKKRLETLCFYELSIIITVTKHWCLSWSVFIIHLYLLFAYFAGHISFSCLIYYRSSHEIIFFELQRII